MTRLIGESACHCCKVTLRTRGPIRTIGLHIKETNQISSQAIIFIGSRLMQFVKSAPVREELSFFFSPLFFRGKQTTTHFLSPFGPQGTPQLSVCIHPLQMGLKWSGRAVWWPASAGKHDRAAAVGVDLSMKDSNWVELIHAQRNLFSGCRRRAQNEVFSGSWELPLRWTSAGAVCLEC